MCHSEIISLAEIRHVRQQTQPAVVLTGIYIYIYIYIYIKDKAIPVTGRGGPQGCETSRIPHFLDNRLTDGGEVLSLTCRPPFTPHDNSVDRNIADIIYRDLYNRIQQN
jgi:hypothetical protein